MHSTSSSILTYSKPFLLTSSCEGHLPLFGSVGLIISDEGQVWSLISPDQDQVCEPVLCADSLSYLQK